MIQSWAEQGTRKIVTLVIILRDSLGDILRGRANAHFSGFSFCAVRRRPNSFTWSYITKKWKKPPVIWKLVASQFAIKFGERFSAVAAD
jgi:hypothetical protein